MSLLPPGDHQLRSGGRSPRAESGPLDVPAGHVSGADCILCLQGPPGQPEHLVPNTEGRPMRAMAVTAYGEPLVQLDLPEPEVPADHALLEVITCGVCFSDVKTARGHMPFSDRLRLPHVPGHEIFGRVMRTEPSGLMEEGTLATVFHYWPCGRCASCRRGDETLCSQLAAWTGFTHHGGFRERIAVPVDRLIAVPSSIDPVHAAPLSCALGTAYRSVGGRGGGGAGMDVVLDTVGHTETLALADLLVRQGGRIVGVGYDPTTTLGVPTPRFVLGELELVGSRYAHRDDLERAIALVSSGRVRPVVGLVRRLEDVNEVFAALESGSVVGRAVLEVAEVADRG